MLYIRCMGGTPLTQHTQLQNKMQTATATFEILGNDYDLETLNHIATNGMSSAIGGLIYYSEIQETYNQNAEEIWNYLDEKAFDFGEESGIKMIINSFSKGNDNSYYEMENLKETAVWMFVELTAHDLLIQEEHPDWV